MIYKDKYGFEQNVEPLDIVLGGFGVSRLKSPEQNLMDYINGLNTQAKEASPAPVNQNPNSLINPYYMKSQPSNDFAPMAMYQQYKQTGQIPQAQSSFVPWSAQTQSAPTQALPTTQTSTAPKATSIGGK